jgi:hypothetical protein
MNDFLPALIHDLYLGWEVSIHYLVSLSPLRVLINCSFMKNCYYLFLSLYFVSCSFWNDEEILIPFLKIQINC